ncbi:deoxyuridine 5'-triphosphate nucleotidohydrolase [Ignicoccus islandicus DSM 13165]|uniref:dUTP diphosphatase n=1 Tax=Ignicoccus islandicus DSM 13165 TaxID=940295 RepID=A0A0U3FM67_9CREN|nr:dUTP diphosphatase [Ignicoccus islandicus]ALU11487.1 deoxyuridine 5'-triphosphate nucleotidohydrolase [Ignicoccus islandicus DSM 13165]
MLAVRRLHPKAKLPKRSNPWDAGLDLFSIENVTIGPSELKVVRTGIAVAIPRGFVGIIKDRSSKALKGLHCLAGVIDPGYRDEIKVIVINLGKEQIEITEGERFAQLLLVPIAYMDPIEVEELPPNDGRSGGFGSTGMK